MKQTKILLYASYALLLICLILLGIFLAVLWLGEDYVGIFSFLLGPLKDNFGDMMTGTIGILLSLRQPYSFSLPLKSSVTSLNCQRSRKRLCLLKRLFSILCLFFLMLEELLLKV